MTISFKMRDGTKVSGLVFEEYDLGHAVLIEVLATNRKNLRGRKMLFAKNDMGALAPGERVS